MRSKGEMREESKEKRGEKIGVKRSVLFDCISFGYIVAERRKA